MSVEDKLRLVEKMLGMPNCQEFCERLACKAIKAGSKLPPSSDVLKMIDMLLANNEVEADPREVMVCETIKVGLYYLAQLCIAHERM